MIFMLLDMICISKRAISFHPSISIKQNGITSDHSRQPRTVTSSYKYAAPKKTKKPTPFDQIILRFKLEALYSLVLITHLPLIPDPMTLIPDLGLVIPRRRYLE